MKLLPLALLCGSLWGQATHECHWVSASPSSSVFVCSPYLADGDITATTPSTPKELPPCAGGSHPVVPCAPVFTAITCSDGEHCPTTGTVKLSQIKPTELRKETMDPLTAAMTAFAAFNQFLCTPAGQKLAMDQEAIFATLMGHFGVHLAPNVAQVAAASAAGAVKAQ